MALLLNFRKSLVLKNYFITLCGRSISTTPALLWFDKRLTRSGSYKEKEQRFLDKDKIPHSYQLIYKAPMELYIKWAVHVTTFTASIIGGAACYQCVSNDSLLDPVFGELTMHSDDIYFFSGGFLAINTVLRFVTYIYVLRIYKDQGKYIAVYHPQLLGGKSHHHFEQGEAKAAHYSYSPWNRVTYKLGGKISLLLDDYFKTPSDFHEMRANTSIK